ncbi:MAG: PAS domain-containing protein, partial [Bacilli bacterium]|nr:PAS domain-containing protein [Bacilli bacterium]
MKNAFFKKIIKHGSFGYVYQKLLYDKASMIVDLVFIDVNPIFEKIMKLNAKEMKKKKASAIGGEGINYLNILQEALRVEPRNADKRTIKYFHATKKTYNLLFYMPKPGYLVTIFVETGKINDPLLDSSGRYKVMVNNMNDCLWILATDMRFTYITPSSKKIFGYSPKEISIMPLERIMTP